MPGETFPEVETGGLLYSSFCPSNRIFGSDRSQDGGCRQVVLLYVLHN